MEMCTRMPTRDSKEKFMNNLLFMDLFGLKNWRWKGLGFLLCLTFTSKLDIPYSLWSYWKWINILRKQDTKTRHMTSNAIFNQKVYYSLVFVYANNYLASVALWRKKHFVKVRVLHSSKYHFKPEEHSAGKKHPKKNSQRTPQTPGWLNLMLLFLR